MPLSAKEAVVLLRDCAKHNDLHKGTKIHADLLKTNLFEKSIHVASSLISMYAKCGAFSKAQQVLEELPVRDAVSWNALITGYAQRGCGQEALNCLTWMLDEGLSPDAVTFTSLLKACGNMGSAVMGQVLHEEISQLGLLKKNVVVGNALVDMYAKCGALARAQQVLDELPGRDTITWNTLIAGYVIRGQAEEALLCFDRMQRDGISPDEVTFVCILKACGSLKATNKGEDVHGQIAQKGLLEENITLGNCLVDMYARCDALAKAQLVLDELPVRDVVSWNAVITGYVQHGNDELAFNCFDQLQCEGVSPDSVTFLCLLKVSGSIGATNRGENMHAEILRRGSLGENNVLSNALTDMYARCGALAEAEQLVHGLCVHDVVAWSSLIAGYALHGYGKRAIECFRRMELKGVHPDSVTLACVLNACSHSGLVDEAHFYFENMTTTYDIVPDVDHLTHMVDLFGRAGHFDKALSVVKKMSSLDCLPLWVSLLATCKTWGNVELAEFCFECAIQLNEKYGPAYLCMSNIYAASGMQNDAERIEDMRVKNNACEWGMIKSS